MAIVQTIKYRSDAGYFAGFLQQLVSESGINGSVRMNDGEIRLVIDESSNEKLEAFGTLTQKYLPHSIFLGEVKTFESAEKVEEGEFVSSDYPISPCMRCIAEITDPASDSYLSDSVVCGHYSNPGNSADSEYLTFSAHYGSGDTLLVTDPAKVTELFYITDSEQKALFSIEKPILKVTIRDEKLREIVGQTFISIRSAFDTRSILAALNAREAEVPYLFFTPSRALRVAVLKDDLLIVRDTLGLSHTIADLHEKSRINRLLAIAKEADFTSVLAADMSTGSGMAFHVYIPQRMLKSIELGSYDIGKFFADAAKHKSYGRLLENFRKAYPESYSELEGSSYGIYETLCCVLGIDGRGYEALSDKSLEFRGNGGLKIDTFFTPDGFDYLSFLASVISFRLADAQPHYIAYSIFEAFGDMVISTLGQLKKEFGVESIVMMGDMFENSVLHSRIVSKFSLSNPYFPKGTALDD